MTGEFFAYSADTGRTAGYIQVLERQAIKDRPR
jgi:hypothetical protein